MKFWFSQTKKMKRLLLSLKFILAYIYHAPYLPCTKVVTNGRENSRVMSYHTMNASTFYHHSSLLLVSLTKEWMGFKTSYLQTMQQTITPPRGWRKLWLFFNKMILIRGKKCFKNNKHEKWKSVKTIKITICKIPIVSYFIT